MTRRRGKALTEEEKQMRRHAQAAARKNAQIAAEEPLFVPLVPKHTGQSEYWHWRKNKVEAAERVNYVKFNHVLDEVFRLSPITHFALEALGEQMFAKLQAKAERTYPSRLYHYGFWRSVLTGEKIELGVVKVENRQPGRPAVHAIETYQHAHLTREQFHRLFPYEDQPPPEHDDQGLAEKLKTLFQEKGDRA